MACPIVFIEDHQNGFGAVILHPENRCVPLTKLTARRGTRRPPILRPADFRGGSTAAYHDVPVDVCYAPELRTRVCKNLCKARGWHGPTNCGDNGRTPKTSCPFSDDGCI
jgi:hypothetical protein